MLQNSTHSRNQNKVRSSHVAHWLSWEMKHHTLETDVFRMSFPTIAMLMITGKIFLVTLSVLKVYKIGEWKLQIFILKEAFRDN